MAGQTVRVALPWPDRRLNPNASVHWGTRSHLRRLERETAFWIVAGQVGNRKLGTRAHVRIEFSPPDNRRRDVDNMLAACKSALDGVSDAIGIDDSDWTLEPVVASDRAGEVRLTITAD